MGAGGAAGRDEVTGELGLARPGPAPLGPQGASWKAQACRRSVPTGLSQPCGQPGRSQARKGGFAQSRILRPLLQSPGSLESLSSQGAGGEKRAPSPAVESPPSRLWASRPLSAGFRGHLQALAAGLPHQHKCHHHTLLKKEIRSCSGGSPPSCSFCERPQRPLRLRCAKAQGPRRRARRWVPAGGAPRTSPRAPGTAPGRPRNASVRVFNECGGKKHNFCSKQTLPARALISRAWRNSF